MQVKPTQPEFHLLPRPKHFISGARPFHFLIFCVCVVYRKMKEWDKGGKERRPTITSDTSSGSEEQQKKQLRRCVDTEEEIRGGYWSKVLTRCDDQRTVQLNHVDAVKKQMVKIGQSNDNLFSVIVSCFFIYRFSLTTIYWSCIKDDRIAWQIKPKIRREIIKSGKKKKIKNTN